VERLRDIARAVQHRNAVGRRELVGEALSFLTETLAPHAHAEEAVLYPEWARLLGFADAAAPMVHDHEAIVARIERLGRASIDDVDTLQELLYGLFALISVHFRKEEDLQLPVFDSQPGEYVTELLARMSVASGHRHG
jgi:iron-sulfur cluster repair protein YtfE (RIC family)